MTEKTKKYFFPVLLTVLIIFHLLNNVIFLLQYPLPEGKDSYAHITAYNNFWQIIENGPDNPFYVQGKSFLYNLVFVAFDYPPLFYLSAFLLQLLLFFLPFNGAILTSSIYLIILLLSVYSIGSRISRQAGMIAAFICGMYPMVFLPSRHFSLEIALAAMVALSIMLLFKTGFFAEKSSSVLLGVCMGLGLLIKQTFALYFGGPFLAGLVFSIKEPDPALRKQKTVNALLSLTVCFIIGIFYYYNPGMYLNVLSRAAFLGAVDNTDLLSWEHLFYYIGSLKNTIGVFFIVLFGLGLFMEKKADRQMFLVLILWITVPLCIFSFIVLKYGEYTIAYLPAFAILTAAAIANIKKQSIKAFIIVLVIAVSLAGYYRLTYAGQSMFYSTYYRPAPRIAAEDSSRNKDSEPLALVMDVLSDPKQKAGMIYDDTDLDFPAYLGRYIFSRNKKHVQLVDFLFRTDAFIAKLDEFDIFIYITRSQKPWTNEADFTDFIEKYNKSYFTDIVISRQAIQKIAGLESHLSEVNALTCDIPDKQDSENIYIYRRVR